MTTTTQIPGTVAQLTVGMDYASQGEVWRVIERDYLTGTGTYRIRGEVLTGESAGNTFDWYGTPEHPVTLVVETVPEADVRIYAHNVKATGSEVIWTELVSTGQAAYIADFIGQEIGCPVSYYTRDRDTHDGTATVWEFWPQG